MEDILKLLLDAYDAEAEEAYMQDIRNKMEEKENLKKKKKENSKLGACKKDTAEKSEDL